MAGVRNPIQDQSMSFFLLVLRELAARFWIVDGFFQLLKRDFDVSRRDSGDECAGSKNLELRQYVVLSLSELQRRWRYDWCVAVEFKLGPMDVLSSLVP
jgi:hypothetical protein